MAGDEVLTIKQVAAELGVPNTRAMDLVRKGRLATEVPRTGGPGTWRIARAELEAFRARERAEQVAREERGRAKRLRRRVAHVTRYVYDEEASAAEHMDVVHEIDDSPAPVSRWVDAMRRLNVIDDPLARKLLALHRDCGSGSGVCDSLDDDPDPMDRRSGWGCETTELIASHFGVEYPSAARPRD